MCGHHSLSSAYCLTVNVNILYILFYEISILEDMFNSCYSPLLMLYQPFLKYHELVQVFIPFCEPFNYPKMHLIKLCILSLPQRLRPRKLIDIYNMNTKKTETFFFSFSLEKPFFLLPSYYTECGIFLISTYFKNFSYISRMSFSFHPTRNLLCRGK